MANRSNCIDHGQKGDKDGYGHSARYVGDKRRNMKMHRIVYCEANELPYDAIDGLMVRHKCDNPRCINPAHLETGTHQDNTDDMTSRDRQAKGEKQASAVLTAGQVAEMRSLYVKGSRKFGAPALARQFGISKSQAHNIVSGADWRHV